MKSAQSVCLLECVPWRVKETVSQVSWLVLGCSLGGLFLYACESHPPEREEIPGLVTLEEFIETSQEVPEDYESFKQALILNPLDSSLIARENLEGDPPAFVDVDPIVFFVLLEYMMPDIPRERRVKLWQNWFTAYFRMKEDGHEQAP
ncbi:MAG: hypothetical protein GY937_20020 [bacterium]|nr:hypothetical protein [bacterium]